MLRTTAESAPIDAGPCEQWWSSPLVDQYMSGAASVLSPQSMRDGTAQGFRRDVECRMPSAPMTWQDFGSDAEWKDTVGAEEGRLVKTILT